MVEKYSKLIFGTFSGTAFYRTVKGFQIVFQLTMETIRNPLVETDLEAKCLVETFIRVWCGIIGVKLRVFPL
jgi:hypothetical protein